MMDINAADTYLRFVRERHAVWVKRQAGLPQPWTEDPLLLGRKFTNTFRILDVGSQYLRGMLTEDPALNLMRCFLYRYTNRPEPWDYFFNHVGRWPIREDLETGLLSSVWREYKIEGLPVFGNAFKMFCGVENKGVERLSWVIDLTARYFAAGSPDDITAAWLALAEPSAKLALLTTIPRCADFMAMQVLTDTGYADGSTHDENRFVAPGPGAIRGARAIFGKSLRPVEVIHWAQDALMSDPPELVTPSGVRTPSLMDVQNTLCEFSKYVRYAGKPAGPTYRPAHPGPQPFPDLPSHW